MQQAPRVIANALRNVCAPGCPSSNGGSFRGSLQRLATVLMSLALSYLQLLRESLSEPRSLHASPTAFANSAPGPSSQAIASPTRDKATSSSKCRQREGPCLLLGSSV